MKDVADKVGVAPSTILRYENGTFDRIKLPVLIKISDALFVNPAWITGKSDDAGTSEYDMPPIIPENVISMPKMSRVPLVGAIACGDPIIAEENIEDYVEMPEHVRADFALRCSGDSMIGARIHDGDIVYIKQDAYVDNGDIAAVLIGEEATLKRVYRNDNSIVFQPENPAYAPLVFSGQEMENIRILGKAVAFTSVIK
ncbi:MAG: helix-turn-helix domain-containing protein [Oscillospiraceae bacterium]|nr:helix-turn-helix domain-containing protein [Oscillospiraceae bacterium]